MKRIKLTDRIKHFFGIHKYGYILRLSDHSHLLECIICKKHFAINTSCKIIVEWDLELEDFHRSMGHIK